MHNPAIRFVLLVVVAFLAYEALKKYVFPKVGITL